MDGPILDATAQQVAELLASRMVTAGEGRVIRVVFYGSRAKGASRSLASDWDFVVVLPDGTQDLPAEQLRLTAAALEGVSGADAVVHLRVDVWVMEESEWEAGRRLPGHTARTVDREGSVLYAAPRPSHPPGLSRTRGD